MDRQHDLFLDHTAPGLLDMDGSCAASSPGLVFTDSETLDLYYTVHHSPTYDHPHTPLCDTDFTPRYPRHPEMGVSLYATDMTSLETHLIPDGNNMLYNLHDSFAFCPVPHYSAPRPSVWDSMTPSAGDSVWDLSAMDPEILNTSERAQSELLSLQELSVSIAQQASSGSNGQDSLSINLAPSYMDPFRYPCGYLGCNKTFKRKEHAKRHYTTKHENSNRHHLRCQYCGKDTFTRTDNLNAHRKLHTRRTPKPSSGVYFVPQALEDLKVTKKRQSFNGNKMDLTVRMAAFTK
ncbi:zinc finger odd-paired-like (opl) [Fusarium circinatum]|uniref:Zinc finger odd-paired-like (Opl) n=1 Tax=Fusarium circinatum TaxID=48490 RepID=A0A8H5SJN3_FUSCI|nr:zinc finger odd-paired-like (opl) [Fusarium circinatum]